jgi:hypothetical protein
MGQPFLFDEVFAINRDLQIDPAGIDEIPAVVVNDYLADPEKAREIVGDSPATNWKTTPDGRNFKDYYDCRLRGKADRARGLCDRDQATEPLRRRQLVQTDQSAAL